MRVLTGGPRAAFLAFFISHVPITILIDAQAVFSIYYPEPLRALIRWYCDVFGDVLMRYPSPPWFQSLVLGEVFFQLPFFFVAIRVLREHSPTLDANASSAGSSSSNLMADLQCYPSWFRTACLIYGAHVSTTLVPILMTFWTSNDQMSHHQKFATTLLYSPYLLFPLALLWHAAQDEFSSSGSKKKKM